MNDTTDDPGYIRIEFAKAFRELCERTNNNPSDLRGKIPSDDTLRELVDHLFGGPAWLIRADERSHRRLFRDPIDVEFIKLWREYEERWEPVVRGVAWYDFFGEWEQTEPDPRSGFLRLWESADEDAKV